MKQIDRLLLQSFVGPFLVAFVISLFVFLMQYLWVYIDDIIGKGADLFLIAELIGYLSVSMMPLALPVAVLIASVMTMGNLAEHYELSSMKSAGIPLLRVMVPLMLCGFAIAGFSFLCSNYLIPVANLKARTRLYDIRKQKPSLSLEEGTFNDDFQGFSIRIGNKGEDNRSLADVMLFRQGSNLQGRLESVTAKKGLMEVTPDARYFILELEDGFQYQEPQPENRGARQTFPFIRTSFEAYRKTFDLSEFEIDRTDESAFQDHQTMLSVRQLSKAVDSIRRLATERRERLGIEVGRFISPLRSLDQAKQDSLDQLVRDSIKLAQDLAFAAQQESGEANNKTVSDSNRVARPDQNGARPSDEDAEREARERAIRNRDIEAITDLQRNMRAREDDRERIGQMVVLPDDRPRVDSSNRSYVHYLTTRPVYRKANYTERAMQFINSIRSYTDGAARRLEAQETSLVQHIYELHLKFSFAFSCFVFLFIGAPLGAIIRKGGFGYPVLASIMLFATFVVLNIMCKKLMMSFTLGAAAAAWIPTAVVFPIGIVLTYAAMNDRKLQVPSWITESKTAGVLGALFEQVKLRLGLVDSPNVTNASDGSST